MSFEIVLEKIADFFQKNGANILSSILILVVGIIITKFLVGRLKLILKKTKLDPICHKFVLSCIKILLYIIILIMALSKLGVPMTSMVTILGAAGLAISLAVQDSLSNLAGGFILLFSKPFKVGDFIEVAGVSGTVCHINILQTRLATIDNKAIYIPNGQVASAKIINFSREENRRLDLTFLISYHDSFELARDVIVGIIKDNQYALSDPPPLVRMAAHKESGIEIAVRIWVKNADYWSLNFDMLEAVKAEFDKNGITIPYNQVDVYIKNNA